MNGQDEVTGAQRPNKATELLNSYSDNSSTIELQVGKGVLPPLKIHFHSILNPLYLERGQATLPNLQFTDAELLF